jgi:enoyl-CoA hydratase
MNPAGQVIVERQGRVGLLSLDRPRALNALNLSMVRDLDAALIQFADAEGIDAVLIRGLGGRAFCAGGDVRALGEAPPGPDLDRMARDFFAGEYRLNYRIHTYKKPFIALIDGITMGGGCGLSLHGSHRIATERTVLAMPETMLGLFPDVGATWFLNRLPGQMGLYLALTGQRIGGSDALSLGLATHFVGSAAIEVLITDLTAAERLDGAAIDRIIAAHATRPDPSVAAARGPRIDQLFAGSTVPDIMRALKAAPEDWAGEALSVLRRASPTSLAAALRQLRGGRDLSVEEMLRIEYRLAARISTSHDFREGVRSILIDKDNAPSWRPADLGSLDDAAVESLFRPLEPDEPELDLP